MTDDAGRWRRVIRACGRQSAGVRLANWMSVPEMVRRRRTVNAVAASNRWRTYERRAQQEQQELSLPRRRPCRRDNACGDAASATQIGVQPLMSRNADWRANHVEVYSSGSKYLAPGVGRSHPAGETRIACVSTWLCWNTASSGTGCEWPRCRSLYLSGLVRTPKRRRISWCRCCR